MGELRTNRLLLRQTRLGDVDDLFAIYSDPKVMRYWSSPPHADRNETETMVKRGLNLAPSVLTYFLIEKDGRAVGRGGVHEGDEIGFILGSDHWGQGIMTEALDAMIPYFFHDLKFPQLTADADPRNKASVATLLKAGFEQTGTEKNTFCVNGEWSNSVYFTLKPSQSAA